MAFWEAGFGGSAGGNYRIRVSADLIGQEEGNNRSLINYNAWIEKVAGSGYYNNSATFGNTNINGYNPGRSLGSYNFAAQSRYNLAVNEQYWIGHDVNGNATPFFGANFNLNNSPYLTSGSTGGGYTLPSLYRYAAPTFVEFVNVTDVTFGFRVVTNRVVDSIAVSIDGAGWQYFDGATTDRTMTFGNSGTGALTSDATHSVYISLRRQDSGLWQEHGTWYINTTASNKFFDLGDF